MKRPFTFLQLLFYPKARLARRQLPRLSQDGLVEYSVQVNFLHFLPLYVFPLFHFSMFCLQSQIPSSALRASSGNNNSSDASADRKSFGKDIEWILAGRKHNNKNTMSGLDGKRGHELTHAIT